MSAARNKSRLAHTVRRGGGLYALVASVVGAGVSCDGQGGCDPAAIPTANLQFVNPDGVVLDERVTLQGFTYAFSGDEWSDALLNQPLGAVTMRYSGNPGRRSQAFAFSTDIDGGYHEFENLYTLLAGTGFDGFWEAQLDCKPRLAPRLLWTGNEDPLDPLEMGLNETSFYGSFFYGVGPIEPCATDMAPRTTGSVKSAIVYDQGMCSFVADLTGPVRRAARRSSNELVSRIMDSAFYNFVTQIERLGVEARTYVRHRGPGSTSVGGGIFYAAAWNFVTVPLMNDLEVRLAYDLQFGIRQSDDQVVVVRNELVHDISGGGIIGDPISNTVAQNLASLLIDDSIAEEEERLLEQQRVDLFPDLECDPKYPHAPVQKACEVQMNFAQLGVQNGATQMNTPDEVLTPQEVSELVKAIRAPIRWSCDLRNVTPGESGQLDYHYGCFFQPPIKRVNVYPHQVEGVFFDEKDVQNASYALWVAAHAAADPADRRRAINRMCRRGETAVVNAGGLPLSDGDETFYGYQKLGAEPHADWQICDSCEAWGCIGCEDAPCECTPP